MLSRMHAREELKFKNISHQLSRDIQRNVINVDPLLNVSILRLLFHADWWKNLKAPRCAFSSIAETSLLPF